MSDLCWFYSNIGVVESISDGIINILGLQNTVNGEMVEIFISDFFIITLFLLNLKFRNYRAYLDIWYKEWISITEEEKESRFFNYIKRLKSLLEEIKKIEVN
jgi:F0F1-type ATP synthase alpha subunit